MLEKPGKSCLTARTSRDTKTSLIGKRVPYVCMREMFIASIYCRHVLFLETLAPSIPGIAIK